MCFEAKQTFSVTSTGFTRHRALATTIFRPEKAVTPSSFTRHMTRGMMRVGLAAVVVGGAAAGRLVPPLDELPSPARNATPEQMRVFRAAQEAGAAAAAAAREALEALLDETGLSYADLVAEFETVELLTNFNARPPGESSMLMDLDLAQALPYKPNPWECLFLLQNASGPGECENETMPLLELQDDAERRVYGYDGFAAGFCPASFAEAADRPVYVALNWHRFDLGNPAFGDVGVVLRRVAASTDKILETRARYGIL